MPWTESQLRRFHAGAARGEPDMEGLAHEADQEAKHGTLRPALHHSSPEERNMPLPPNLMAKAQHMARRRFAHDVIAKLRAKRLSGAVPAHEKKPDEEDLGGYDALEQMYHAGGDDKGR